MPLSDETGNGYCHSTSIDVAWGRRAWEGRAGRFQPPAGRAFAGVMHMGNGNWECESALPKPVSLLEGRLVFGVRRVIWWLGMGGASSGHRLQRYSGGITGGRPTRTQAFLVIVGTLLSIARKSPAKSSEASAIDVASDHERGRKHGSANN